MADLDWDGWRATYDTWGLEQQQAFYDRVFVNCRAQARFDALTFHRFLDYIDRDVAVVELGGWDGEFAATMLHSHPEIVWWENHEISRAAVEGSVCHDSRFRPVALDGWYWDSRHVADVFVASHVLEHLKWRDVVQVLDATTVRYAYLQVPLAEQPTCWNGYRGSHILEAGWADLTDELAGRGFVLLHGLSKPGARCFEEAG